ncbi:MAG: YhcH/YjgK/YiaL family protein [Gemmatimonadales bacterium]|nr:YhcH/YjgK/YiaL family protein [Gemmatimonadales bacterium]
MIHERLERAGRLGALPPRLAAALDWLRRTDLTTLEPGRIDLDGDRLFAIVQRYDTKPRAAAHWEAHRKYIDVQYVVAGEECVGIALKERLRETGFDEAKDFVSLEGTGDELRFRAGEVMVLWPEDAHMPGLEVGAPAPVSKIVLKAAVAD